MRRHNIIFQIEILSTQVQSNGKYVEYDTYSEDSRT